MILKLILLTVTMLIPFEGSAGIQKPLVISGYDDVLRQANNIGIISAGLKLFGKDRSFAGMRELYQALTEDAGTDDKFFLLSASSEILTSRIERHLHEAGFPSHETHLRSWLTEWSIEKFKTARIHQILNAHPNQKFIAIFDNSDASLQIAKEIQREHSPQIMAIYLREVTEKPVPSGVISFTSAFEIARHEYLNNRLELEKVLKIGEVILSVSRRQDLIPDYAVCPKQMSLEEISSERLRRMQEQIRDHIQKLCQ